MRLRRQRCARIHTDHCGTVSPLALCVTSTKHGYSTRTQSESPRLHGLGRRAPWGVAIALRARSHDGRTPDELTLISTAQHAALPLHAAILSAWRPLLWSFPLRLRTQLLARDGALQPMTPRLVSRGPRCVACPAQHLPRPLASRIRSAVAAHGVHGPAACSSRN